MGSLVRCECPDVGNYVELEGGNHDEILLDLSSTPGSDKVLLDHLDAFLSPVTHTAREPAAEY